MGNMIPEALIRERRKPEPSGEHYSKEAYWVFMGEIHFSQAYYKWIEVIEIAFCSILF